VKLALAWLAAVAIALVMAGSCSINHKSSEFECATQADCAGFANRTCTDGFCVLQTTPIDASVDTLPPSDSTDARPDSAVCPPGCTSCNQERHECTIDCAVTSCNAEVVCPTGWACVIGCTTANSCRSGIDCTEATGCTVTCSGAQACRDLACGEGACKVACTGLGACRNMDCSDACACDLSCAPGVAACADTTCPFGCGGGGRCSSTQLPGCNTCP